MAHERFAGYRSALEMHGIPLDFALVRQGNFHPEYGLEQTNALLALDNPPTAIFAGSDWQAADVYRAMPFKRHLPIACFSRVRPHAG